MSTGLVLVLLILALLVIVAVIWLVRSRGNTTGPHVDTSMTAIGAATEAVEDLVERVAHKAEDLLKAEVEAAGDDPSNPAALMRASAATMASAGGIEAGLPETHGEPDNLRQLKGVGPKLASVLNDLGVTRFAQIAAWSESDIDSIDAQLGTFKGRIRRDNWVEQAAFLSKGDTASFEAKYGKLEG